MGYQQFSISSVVLCLLVILSILSGLSCGNEETVTVEAVPRYSVSGTVEGLDADGLVLQLNSSEAVELKSGASNFAFSTTIEDGAAYVVSVKYNANNRNAVISNSSGSIRGADVSNVSVTCSSIDYTSLYSASAVELEGLNHVAFDFADIDNDGDQDLLLTGSDSVNAARTILYKNDGSGAFSEATSPGLPAISRAAVAFADINTDGWHELFLFGSGEASLYGNNAGTFTESAASAFTNADYGSIALADVDGDGDLDLFVSGEVEESDCRSLLYNNDGSGEFSLNESSAFTGVNYSDSAFADLNGNGSPDLVLCGHYWDATEDEVVVITEVYTNNGGVFQKSGAGLTGLYKGSLDLADIDGDGSVDLIINGENDADNLQTILYRNNGNAEFTEDASAPFTDIFRGVCRFCDVDNDGDPDLVMTGRDAGGAEITTLYINDGTGTFSDAGVALTAVDLSFAGFADIDNDGDMDMLICGYSATEKESILYLNTMKP